MIPPILPLLPSLINSARQKVLPKPAVQPKPVCETCVKIRAVLFGPRK